MNLTDAHIASFNEWLQGALPEAHRHFLDELEAPWMLYGTGTAQLQYLAVIDAVNEAKNSVPQQQITRQRIRDWYDWHSGNKQLQQRVSNYWIQFHADTVKVNRTGDQARPMSLSAGAFATHESHDFFTRFNTSGDTVAALSYSKLVAGMQKHDERAPARPKLKDINTHNLIRFYAVRRACKFLMYDAIGAGWPIRYVLDDLTLSTAASRGRVDGKVPVCTSELREAFRFWDFFEPFVDFYREFTLVVPPWQAPTADAQTLADWGAYAGVRARKLLAGDHARLGASVVGLLQECDQAAAANRHIDAIALYHESRPSRYSPRNLVNLEGATL
jgi:hypothetical protein